MPIAARLRSVWPFGPIFSLELRQLARRPQTYVLRCVYLGILLAVLSFAWLVMNGDRSGTNGIVQQAARRAETGRVFFQVFGIFSILAMQLTGPVLTSTALNAERTRRTLDVLLMTPISAWQIAAGKLMSRLWTAVMLLALALPLLAIVRLLGGVDLSQIAGTLALCAATALGSAAIGLLLSSVISRAWAVVLLAYFAQFAVYFVLPILVSVLYSQISPRQQSMTAMAAANPMWTESAILMGRGFMAIQWWPAIVVQIALAGLLTFLTATTLRRSSRATVVDRSAGELPVAAPKPTDVIPVETASGVALPPPLPAIAPVAPPAHGNRDVSDTPVLWHELRRPLMSRTWQRITGMVLTLGLLAFSYFVFWMTQALKDMPLQIPYAIIMQTMLTMIAVVISATAIASEKESDTWTTLITTPLSAKAIVYGKFLGILRRLMWPWLLIVAHFAAFTLAGVISIGSFFIVIVTTATFTPIWIATGVYLSLRSKRPTTAVVLNLMLPVIAFAGVPMALSCVQSLIYPHDSNWWYEITSYYLPYYFTGTGMVRPNIGRDFAYLNTFALPMTSTRVSLTYLPLLAIASGAAQLFLTWLMLVLTCVRFDKIVGRAESGHSRSSVPAVTPS